MRTLTKGSIGVIAALSPLLLAPQAGVAQEEEMYEEAQCTFQVTPEYVQAGQAAVSVAVVLSSSIGEIEDIDAKESGLALADPADLAPTEMANPEEDPEAGGEMEEPKPVEMALTENEATLWLNTEEANAGSHEFALEGTDGSCKGSLTVEGGEEPSAEDGR